MTMKLLCAVLLLVVLALAEVNGKRCEQLVREANTQLLLPGVARYQLGEECGTRPRKFKSHERTVEDLMLKEIMHSYELLLMGNQFGKDVQDRPGFKKYFQSLSDEAWEHALDLAKYINKRGSKLHQIRQGVQVPLVKPTYIGEELSSLGAAMDLQQHIIHDLGRIHEGARNPEVSDPDLAAYMERMLKEEISHVRDLAGHLTNLNAMYDQEQKQLALFHFDNMLNES